MISILGKSISKGVCPQAAAGGMKLAGLSGGGTAKVVAI
jgi:hypothetical protein